MKTKKVCQFVYIILFFLIIAIMSIFSIKNSYRPLGSMVKSIFYGKNTVKINILNFQNTFEKRIAGRKNWIDLHGLAQRIMLKNEVGNFDVVKDKAGMLHLPISPRSDELLAEFTDNLSKIYHYASEKKISFLYVQAPAHIINGKTEFIAGLDNKYKEDALDRFLGYIDAKTIPFLDMRQYIKDMSVKEIYYKTDHHWSLKTAFRTMTILIDKINILYNLNIDKDWKIRNLSDYIKISYQQSFLGSIGIRTGKYYAGKDDFEIYIPIFETDLSYSHYENGNLTLTTGGDFYSTFIDESILHNASYNNKYNAFLFGGYVENKIVNYCADNELKCLLISDSFSRIMAPYLSLCFRETVYLDPQPERYTDSYAAYIDKYKPDVIVVLFNGQAVYADIPF